MNIPPSPMDLASLSAVKNWLNISGTSQDQNLQACLTAASIFFLRQTGRGPRNWQNATQSPFNQSVAYQEVYDGQSGNKLFLRNFPINSVASLNVGTIAVQPSTGVGLPGYVIDDQGRAIAIRAGGGGATPQTFAYVATFGNGYTAGAGAQGWFRPFGAGPQSIAVSYSAGFNESAVTGDLETITEAWTATHAYTTGDIVSDGTFLQQATNSGTSGTLAPPWSAQNAGTTLDGTGATQITWINLGVAQAPYTISISAEVAVLADGGVTYFSSGIPLDKVLISPSAGQYFLVAPGQYLFNAADAGTEVLVDYTLAGTPQDIVLAVIQLVSLNYKRRDWIGQRSVAMKDVGSTSYTLLMDPMIREVISQYTRSSFSS
jgi:hypothetical protein